MSAAPSARVVHLCVDENDSSGVNCFCNELSAAIGRLTQDELKAVGFAAFESRVTRSAAEAIDGLSRSDGSVRTFLHLHGLWPLPLHRAAVFARRSRIPVVWSTHGMTAPWAMNHNRWKKALAWRFYQKRDLAGAALLHVTSRQEADWNRALGLTAEQVVIPLGTHLPDTNAANLNVKCHVGRASSPCVIEEFPFHSPGRGRPGHGLYGPQFAAVLPEISDAQSEDDVANRRLRVLFVGRVHPVKGLVNLIEAAGLIRRQGAACGLSLRIVGPDEAGHLAELQAVCERQGVEWTAGVPVADDESRASAVTVSFAGEKHGAALAKEYADSDLLVLPSFTENFGGVVVDALAHAKPVLASRFTPWRELEERQCGWWVDNAPDRLAQTLRSIAESFACPEGRVALRAMGARGRDLAVEKYTWSGAARQMAAALKRIVI